MHTVETLPIEEVDTVIIGAGVVGLAIARELAQSFQTEVAVLEQHARCGEEVSSHNSGVIHAGLYYPKSWLRTQLCIKGRKLLYQYAEEKGITYRRVGKLVVATSEQQGELQRIYKQAQQNGVNDLQWLNRNQLQHKEPNVEAEYAIFSPSSGIIDTAQYIQQLEIDAQLLGVNLCYQHRVGSVVKHQAGYRLVVNNAFIVQCRQLINAAGLGATHLTSNQTTYFGKGHYYSYQAPPPFQHLVYPLPDTALRGLGVHSTMNLAGQVQFGPDISYQDHIDYSFDENRKLDFISAIQRYYPQLNPDKLMPGQTGVRPKLSGPNEMAKDFHISLSRDKKIRLIELFGIESPGLTASLAIANYVRELLNEQ